MKKEETTEVGNHPPDACHCLGIAEQHAEGKGTDRKWSGNGGALIFFRKKFEKQVPDSRTCPY